MIPLKVRLKGFKGIRSAWDVDEIELDLSRLPKGLVAITGPIGSGKTTLLDNLHPYRIMPYRAGDYTERSFSFYSETYGTDARKELEFLVGERMFRSVVVIDAERKGQEAYLYREEGGEWFPYGNTEDGKLDEYDRAVRELLGSPRGFFTYVYRHQRARELSGYTKGEMKEIFTELLDVEDLKKKAELSRERKDALLGALAKLRQERKGLEETVSAAARKRSERADIEKKLAELESSIRTSEEEIHSLREQVKTLEVRITLQHDSERNREHLLRNIGEKEERIHDLGSRLRHKEEYYSDKYRAISVKLRETRKIAESAPILRNAAQEESSVLQALEALRVEQEELDSRYIAYSAHLTKIARTETKVKEVGKQLDTLRLRRAHTKEMLKQSIRHAEEAEKKLKEVPCGERRAPASAFAAECPFVRSAVAESASLPVLRQRLRELNREDPSEERLEEQIAALEKTVSRKQELESEAKRCLDGRETAKKTLADFEKKLLLLREKAKKLPEAEAAERALPLLEQEERELLEEGSKALESLRKEVTLLERERDSLKKELDSLKASQGLEEEREKAQRLIETIMRRIAASRTEQMQLFEMRGRVQEELRQAAVAGKRMKAVDMEIEKVNTDIAEWAFLEKALGNDGLIALEIDDAGPTVAGITNDLIHTCFGGRFSVRIDTQGDKARGNGTKEIFDIVVFDAERNEQKSLKSMSGGEKILIEAAVKNALCIFNARRSGIPFGTLFTDEEDGGLDAEKKKDFIRIKRRVLELGEYEREFFISHTPEVVALADETLSMEELVSRDTGREKGRQVE